MASVFFEILSRQHKKWTEEMDGLKRGEEVLDLVVRECTRGPEVAPVIAKALDRAPEKRGTIEDFENEAPGLKGDGSMLDVCLEQIFKCEQHLHPCDRWLALARARVRSPSLMRAHRVDILLVYVYLCLFAHAQMSVTTIQQLERGLRRRGGKMLMRELLSWRRSCGAP